MTAVLVDDERPSAQAESEPEPIAWHLATRILFRFTFVYCTLFCLLIPQITLTFTGWFGHLLPVGAHQWQLELLQPALRWVGRHVFGVEASLHRSGSGDQRIYWLLIFCILLMSVAATVVWSVLDRHRTEYRTLAGWFLFFVRLCVAGQMLFYGLAKAVPTQMRPPALSTLLAPYGDLSPMSVLWNQVGSSQPYEILLGLAEVTAGILLLLPRTAILGSMLGVVSMAQVFVLNMTFDVPVKILSGHLLLLELLLLAPEAPRLLSALVLDRPTGPSTTPNPFPPGKARRFAALAQIVIAFWLVGSGAYLQWDLKQKLDTHPPLYGIWEVQDFVHDGRPVPPLTTDRTRWQRIVFEYPGVLQFQLMNGDFGAARATVDPAGHITIPGPPAGNFDYQQPDPDHLVLDGTQGPDSYHLTLTRQDPNAFPQRAIGFHWVQDSPVP